MDSLNNGQATATTPLINANGGKSSHMNIGFSVNSVILIAVPVDMRCGFMRLNALVHDKLGMDLSKEHRAVVFFNRSRGIVKVVTADGKGSVMVTRKLKEGNFAKILMRPDGPAKLEITVSELERILDGGDLLVRRKDFYGEDIE